MQSNQLTDTKYTHNSLIIGSFRKHYEPIIDIIKSFHARGINVLSPKTAKVLNPDDEFVVFDYDPPHLTDKEIQDLVLEKMHRSDFVYLVNPGGYIGVSAAFEIGYCAAHGIDVYAMESSSELCMKYIKAVKSPDEMIEYALQEYEKLGV